MRTAKQDQHSDSGVYSQVHSRQHNDTAMQYHHRGHLLSLGCEDTHIQALIHLPFNKFPSMTPQIEGERRNQAKKKAEMSDGY
jgi:hypothetical protein